MTSAQNCLHSNSSKAFEVSCLRIWRCSSRCQHLNWSFISWLINCRQNESTTTIPWLPKLSVLQNIYILESKKEWEKSTVSYFEEYSYLSPTRLSQNNLGYPPTAIGSIYRNYPVGRKTIDSYTGRKKCNYSEPTSFCLLNVSTLYSDLLGGVSTPAGLRQNTMTRGILCFLLLE